MFRRRVERTLDAADVPRHALAAAGLLGASLLFTATSPLHAARKPVAKPPGAAIASAHAPDFYAQLNRPAWAPPAWLFGPVWTVLYVLMALSAWMV